MSADAEDLGLTIHPRPSLSETLMFAAEKAEGTITNLYRAEAQALTTDCARTGVGAWCERDMARG
jgi:hypothetical protein